MKLKKLVPAALSLALVLSLAACGSPSEPSGSTPPDTNPPATGSAVPGTADDSLQKVLDAGKLTIAAEGNWVPYVYNEDGTGELTGFEVDIAKEICSRLGVEPDFQISSSWDPVEAGMDSGRYDCIICGVNPKPERQEKYNMSIAYAENPFCLVVAGDNEEITSFADLAGRSCANALNSTAMDLIVSGRADATVNNVAAVEEYMKERPDMNVKIAAIYEPEEGEEWIIQSAVAFQKGADTLTEKVNEILQEMIDDGTCYDLTVQYFGQSVADSTSIYQK